MTPIDSKNIQTWVFDLDHTLYPAKTPLFVQIEKKMVAYMMRHLHLDRPTAERLRRDYWQRFGTTLAGLLREHQIDPDPFLDEVHDIDFSVLSPCADLAAAIGALDGKKIVYTNGTVPYARSVLQARGLSGLFDAVYGVEDANYRSKPHRAAFETVFAKAQLDPHRAIMFEDDPRNLEVPHALGLKTVLVTEHPSETQAPHIHAQTNDLAAFLKALCAKYDKELRLRAFASWMRCMIATTYST